MMEAPLEGGATSVLLKLVCVLQERYLPARSIDDLVIFLPSLSLSLSF